MTSLTSQGSSPPERSDPPVVRLRPPRHRIERRAIAWWTIQAIAVAAPVLLVAIVGYVLWEAARPVLIVAVIGAGVFAIVGLFVEPAWRYAVHRWEVTDEAVYALTGWIVREWRVAPISRIQTVDAIRGPVEQMLGLSTLRVTTASSEGAIEIVGLDDEVASDVAERLTIITERTPGDAT